MRDQNKSVVLAITPDPEEFLALGEKARKEGYVKLDGIMPYALHGFEEALGMKHSWIPIAAKTMLVIGAFLGGWFAIWTHAYSWPINVGGKPMIAWPAYVQIIFECGILFAGITTLLSLFHCFRAFPGSFPKVYEERLTDDLFAVVVPVEGNGDADSIVEFFKSSGAGDVRKYDE